MPNPAVPVGSALSEADLFLLRAFTTAGYAVYVVDRDLRFLAANPAALRTWQRSRDEIIGRELVAAFPCAAGSLPYQAHLRALELGEPQIFDAPSPVLNRSLEIQIHPVNGGLCVGFREKQPNSGLSAE